MPSLNLAGTRLYTLVAYLGFLFGFSPRSFDRFLWTQRNAAAYLLHATVQMGYFSATGEAAKSNKRLEGRFVRIGQVESGGLSVSYYVSSASPSVHLRDLLNL